MSTAYINIGSNQGDREKLIKQAVALIEHWAGTEAAVSRTVESEPWGFTSTSRFINVGIALNVDCTPEQLLDALLEIEHGICPSSHRDSLGNYIDRYIDIDLIAVDSEIRDSDRLTLPTLPCTCAGLCCSPWRNSPLTGYIPDSVKDRTKCSGNF